MSKVSTFVPPKSVGIVAIPELRFLIADVAAMMVREWGARIHLYCRSEQEIQFYTKRYADGRFASIVFGDWIMREVEVEPTDVQAALGKAAALETELGGTLHRLAVIYRQIGRGFMIGGHLHPRSRITEEVGYAAAVNALRAHIEGWLKEVDVRGIELMLGNMADLAHVCRLRNVPLRALRHARYQNLHYWSPDEFGSMPWLPEIYRTVEVDQEDVRTLSEPYLTEKALRRLFVADSRLLPVLKDVILTFLRHVNGRLRGYEKVKRALVTEDMLYFVRRWRAWMRVLDNSHVDLASLRGKPFVFFPLQTEPEATLLQNSPEYFFQMEAIQAISRSLPAGMTLAVKEALLAVGRRPSDFYDQIAALPNVVMIKMLEQGVEIVREAAAVVTISSTAGMEASVMGRPVIYLGRHNYFDFLPHTKVVRDLGRLSEALRWAISGQVDAEAAQLAGARFLKAISRCCFSLGRYDYLNMTSYEEADVVAAFRGLEETLGGTYLAATWGNQR